MLINDAEEQEIIVPISSIDKFQNIIDQYDFMIEEDDEGMGAYADCEMMPTDAEPSQF